MREDIKSMTLEELTQALKDMGEPAFRGRQIFTWLHQQGAVSFGEICRRTRMLKSLVNRTIGALVRRGFLQRRTGEDKRTTYVLPVREKLPEFLEEHERSLALARRIIALIGKEDARTFCRIAETVFNADPLPDREPNAEHDAEHDEE